MQVINAGKLGIYIYIYLNQRTIELREKILTYNYLRLLLSLFPKISGQLIRVKHNNEAWASQQSNKQSLCFLNSSHNSTHMYLNWLGC